MMINKKLFYLKGTYQVIKVTKVHHKTNNTLKKLNKIKNNTTSFRIFDYLGVIFFLRW